MPRYRNLLHQQGLDEGRNPITGRALYVPEYLPPLPDHDGDDFRDLRDDAHEFGGLVHPNPTENEHGPVGPDNPTLPF